MMKNSIARFTEMYDAYYEQAAKELRNGRKETHWMWFIFPQIKGLGRSETAVYYAVQNLQEAKDFLNSSCGKKMQTLLEILLELHTDDPESVFGCIDALKLASSMTLFATADPENPVYGKILDKFYHGNMDEKTLDILNTRHADHSELFDRFKGMFWGLVVGDCLGSPIQFTDKDAHPYITEMEPCRHFHVPAGYWTDDSSMAFCIAESLVRLKKYDLNDIAWNFVRWYRNGFCSSKEYAFDVGGATASAMDDIENGSLRNGTETSQGNGSVMRFAPAYIWNYGKQDDKILHEISDLTHASGKIRETISLMARVCDEHILGKRTGIKSIYKTREEVNNSGWAVSTLQAALWAFETTSTFEDGLIAAVNLGGDADSIGAVFGQIAGAYYGYDAIPRRWLDAVKDQQKINDLIESLILLKGGIAKSV